MYIILVIRYIVQKEYHKNIPIYLSICQYSFSTKNIARRNDIFFFNYAPRCKYYIGSAVLALFNTASLGINVPKDVYYEI